MEPSFSEGEHVFCYEPMLGRTRVLYEAKVIGVARRRIREPAYKLRFINWNKIYNDRSKKCNYDHEIGESFMCKADEKRRRLMHKLTRAAAKMENEVDRMRVVSDLLVQAYNERKITTLPPGLDVDDSKLDSPDDNTPLKEVKEAAEEHRVEVEIDDELKKILEHDCQQIKCRGKVACINGPTVIEILEAFMRYHANILLFEKPKHCKDTYKAEQRISLTKEVLEGIRCLFDTVLSTNLLYTEELSYHQSLMLGRDFSPTRDNAFAVSRRQTRSSTAETPQTATAAEIPPMAGILQTESTPHASTPREIFKTTSVTQQLLGKLEQHTGSPPSEMPSSKKPRLATHLHANIQNSASGRSTPTQNQQPAADSGHRQRQQDALIREVNEWRLVPRSILEEKIHQNQRLASSVYGAIHLLRMFVMLPEILARMRLGDEWRTFLLSVFTFLLSYLLGERSSLYDNIAYVAAVPVPPSPLKENVA